MLTLYSLWTSFKTSATRRELSVHSSQSQIVNTIFIILTLSQCLNLSIIPGEIIKLR